MALCLSSPSGCPYDEDEDVGVLESTAAEFRCPSRPRLPEISVISPGLDSQLSITEPVSVIGCVLLLSRSYHFPGLAFCLNIFLMCTHINVYLFTMSSQKVAVQPPVRRGSADEGNAEKMKVFVRIRPLTDAERNKGEEQV